MSLYRHLEAKPIDFLKEPPMKRARTVEDYLQASGKWQAEMTRLCEILRTTDLKEEIKWGAPCYTYKGKNVVGAVAFKAYVGLWFHQGAMLQDEKNLLINAQQGKTRALRQWRMQSASDIKPRIIKSYVRESIALLDAGKSLRPIRKTGTAIPALLSGALQKDRVAAKKFAAMTPGKRREYADYIDSAKRENTRENRLKKIIPLIRQGHGLNDKYRT